MSKSIRNERFIYLVILIAFLGIGGLNLVSFPDESGTLVWNNCYSEIFTNKGLDIYGNIFLAIPYLSAFINVVLFSVALGLNKVDPNIEYTIRFMFIFMFAFGLLYASLFSNIYPFGMVIVGFSLATIIVAIIFHYGVKRNIV